MTVGIGMAPHRVISARCAERDALDTLKEMASPRCYHRTAAELLDDLEYACAMTALARVEQVRAVIALLSWGLS